MPTPTSSGFNFSPVGIISSPFREKFAIPRQPGLAPAATGEIHLLGDHNREETIRGLEDFSHLWVIYVFHKNLQQGWKTTVRPPRLGGNQKLGIFATRSPYRPNPIGLSVVELKGIEKQGKQWVIKLAGIDLVDGTPILDIKPYIAYADAISHANGGFTDNTPPPIVPVHFSAESEKQLDSYRRDHPGQHPNLRLLIEQVLGQQPQPAYHNKNEQRQYGMSLYHFNIRWSVSKAGCTVEEVTSTLEQQPR